MNPNYPYIQERLREIHISQAAIAQDLGLTRQAVNYGLRVGTLRRVQRYVADLLGEPVERLFPPAQKPGPKPKIYSRRIDPSIKTRRCA